MKLKPGQAKWVNKESQLVDRSRCRKLACEFLESRDLCAVLQVGASGAFASIQSAVDHARTDDVIDVSPGIYAERIDWSRMGSAVNRQPGNLTIRGMGANVVLQSPQGSAIFNSSPLVGDLVLRQLIVEVPTAGAADAGSGVSLHQLQGNVTVSNNVFRQIAHHGLDLLQVSGTVNVTDSQFLGIGDGDSRDAIRLREVSGSATFHDNSFDNVTGGAISVINDNSNLLLMVDDNSVLGDVASFSTTRRGFDIRLGGSTVSDLTFVNNQVDGVAETGFFLSASQSARLQARIAENSFSSFQGPIGLHLDLGGTSQTALSVESNTISDAIGTGSKIVQHDASQLNGIFLNNLFLNLGDDSNDQGLAITSSSSAIRNLRVEKNDFATVAGDGLVLSSTGSGTTNAAVTDNVFTDVDGVSGPEAIAAFRAEATGSMRLLLKSNTVLDGERDAYFLKQTNGDFLLEGTLATPISQMGADNVGLPITVQGSIQIEGPGQLSAVTPLLLGDTAWFDSDGDGILNANDLELPGLKVSLAGIETVSGAAVNRETLTDSRGTYLFSALLPGNYTLTAFPPLGRAIVPANQGPDELLDSDFDRSTRSVTVSMSTDDLSVDIGLWANWQNPANHLDVDGDSLVVPRDVLLVINDLNANGARALPEPFPATDTPRYLDVDGDGFVAPLDVLQVINYLNALADNGEGEALFLSVGDRDEQDGRSGDADRDLYFAAIGLEGYALRCKKFESPGKAAL